MYCTKNNFKRKKPWVLYTRVSQTRGCDPLWSRGATSEVAGSSLSPTNFTQSITHYSVWCTVLLFILKLVQLRKHRSYPSCRFWPISRLVRNSQAAMSVSTFLSHGTVVGLCINCFVLSPWHHMAQMNASFC